MRQYLDLLRAIKERGVRKGDRTGTGTLSLFGYQMRFDLDAGFPAAHDEEAAPALDHPRAAVVPQRRHEHPVPARQRRHDLGRVGRRERRAWARSTARSGVRGATADGRQIDQIQRALDMIRKEPNSRRIIVSAWNVGELEQMALAPCHALFQFHVAQGRLSCQLYQRSADVFLGVPFNIASYALLIHMMAQQTDLEARRARLDGRRLPSVHEPHVQAELQLGREPLPLPRLVIKRRPDQPVRLPFRRLRAARLLRARLDQSPDSGVSERPMHAARPARDGGAAACWPRSR